MSNITKADNIKCWRRCGTTVTLTYTQWLCLGSLPFMLSQDTITEFSKEFVTPTSDPYYSRGWCLKTESLSPACLHWPLEASLGNLSRHCLKRENGDWECSLVEECLEWSRPWGQFLALINGKAKAFQSLYTKYLKWTRVISYENQRRAVDLAFRLEHFNMEG